MFPKLRSQSPFKFKSITLSVHSLMTSCCDAGMQVKNPFFHDRGGMGQIYG